LPAAQQEEFVFRQMQTGRTISLQGGTGEVLTRLRERGCVLGIASNSQAYTLRELREHLAPAGLSLDLFDRDVCFWSFAHGFSKPDPHVFQILTARLKERGIRSVETLMVGDRLDNDIEPVQAFGWQTWLLTSSPTAGELGKGTFADLLVWLR
jgi:FMN phosphatase YigB (HAD superfamily)